ncbi:hypothetical protein [Leuconostoc citreum]
MSEHADSVISMIKHLKSIDKVQSGMISLLNDLDNQMKKLNIEYIKFNELGLETNDKTIVDLVHDLNSIEPINYGQNIKELKYGIETSRQDLIPYQSYLKKLV